MGPGGPERWSMTRRGLKRGKGRMTETTKKRMTKLILSAHVPLRLFVVFGMLLGMLGAIVPGASAASVTSAAFSGGTGTVSVGDTLYAKKDGGLTLKVMTDTGTKCVVVSGAHSGQLTSKDATASWSFSFTAPGTTVPDGVQTVEAKAYQNQDCTPKGKEDFTVQNASYILDNSGPTLKPSMTDKTGWSPAPNAAGWNKSDVTITWSATDAGSGVASGPTPATASVTTNTPATGVEKTATASDRLGNIGNGSVVVKLDETAPTLSPTRTPANANDWNNTDVTIT